MRSLAGSSILMKTRESARRANFSRRLVFESIRSWLVRKGFSYRQLFWILGWLAFFISALADQEPVPVNVTS